MYHIETKIALRVLGITRRTLYNYQKGRMTPTKFYPPILDEGDISILDGKSVITQKGFERILNCKF
jgi:hypothetical protein